MFKTIPTISLWFDTIAAFRDDLRLINFPVMLIVKLNSLRFERVYRLGDQLKQPMFTLSTTSPVTNWVFIYNQIQR